MNHVILGKLSWFCFFDKIFINQFQLIIIGTNFDLRLIINVNKIGSLHKMIPMKNNYVCYLKIALSTKLLNS